MGSGRVVVRRGVAALTVAFGLVLMHGGIGQAVACAGMSGAMASPTGPSREDSAMTDARAGGDADHDPPADQPVSVHAAPMCVSTPGSRAGAGPDTAQACGVARVVPLVPAGQPAVSPATTRDPPPPDLVSVLCVSRR